MLNENLPMSEFEITPYVGVGNIELGMSYSNLKSTLGDADSRREQGNAEIYFWTPHQITVIFRKGAASEIGFVAFQKNATINNVFIFNRHGPETHSEICKIDSDPRYEVGFTVLFSLGIALADFKDHADDYDPRAVTVFSEGVWDRYDPDLELLPKPNW